jgi:hypothetical protein
MKREGGRQQPEANIEKKRRLDSNPSSPSSPVILTSKRHDLPHLLLPPDFLLSCPTIDPLLHLVARLGGVDIDGRDDALVVLRDVEG